MNKLKDFKLSTQIMTAEEISNALSSENVQIGKDAKSIKSGIAIGLNSKAMQLDDFGENWSIAIGSEANVCADYAVQFGNATNIEPNSFKFKSGPNGNVTIVNSDGKIPISSMQEGFIHLSGDSNIGKLNLSGGIELGRLSQSGTWAYTIIDKNDTDKTYTFESNDGISAGMWYSAYYCGTKDPYGNRDFYGKVLSVIGSNMISVDKMWEGIPETLSDSYIWFSTTDYESEFKGSDKYIGRESIAAGYAVKSYQIGSHSEGCGSVAAGKYAHAEGYNTIAAYAAHSEGKFTHAFGQACHAEGNYTIAGGYYNDNLITNAHAEGLSSIALGGTSHAEGRQTSALGYYSHAEGDHSIALGENSHAGGLSSVASGKNSYAIGLSSVALGTTSHAEGEHSIASGDRSHAEGYYTVAYNTAHAEGNQTVANNASHSEGCQTSALGYYSHTEGYKSVVIDINDNQTTASHAEGYQTSALGNCSHSEGIETITNKDASHAEGYQTSALGSYSHAEGRCTVAGGLYGSYHVTIAHAEGEGTVAMGKVSHAAGISAETYSSYTYAWNGDKNNKYVVPPNKRDGTFNINPVNGLSGFYVGSNNIVSAFIDLIKTNATIRNELKAALEIN